jgi:glycosyltransferase involved in cell wall biosynthesis
VATTNIPIPVAARPAAGPGRAAPRVLFLSPVLPAPLDRGQNVRIHNIVAGLARQFRVTLVVPDGPGLAQDCPLWSAVERVVAVPRAARGATAGELLRFIARHRVLLRPAVVSALQPYRQVVDRLPLDEYSAIWVERTQLAVLVRRLGRRVVVDFDDLEHRARIRKLRRGLSGPQLVREVVQAVRMFVREIVLARSYGCCAVASDADVAYLRRWGLRTAAILPNGAATPAPSGSHPAGRVGPIREGRLVFVGNLGYEPNVDALAHFEENIRPALDRIGVAVELTAVGPGVSDALAARLPRVHFRGFVPDLAAELDRSDISVVPLRLGGGTKLKVLDAMAAGVPVVTTSIGAEGLRVQDGVHLLVADSPEDFAAAVARLLGDRILAAELGEHGRRLVEQEYSWRAVQDRAVALVTSVVTG